MVNDKQPFPWTSDVLRAWAAARTEQFFAYMDKWPTGALLQSEVDFYRIDPIRSRVRRGDRLFLLTSTAEVSSIEVEEAGQAAVVLTDGSRHTGPNESVGQIVWQQPSPDGEAIAYGVIWRADERCTIFVVDVDGNLRCPGLEATTLSRVAWLPQSQGFYYSGFVEFRPFESDEELVPIVRLFRLDDEEARPAEPLRLDGYLAFPESSPDGKWTLIYSGSSSVRPVAYRENEPSTTTWTEFLIGVEGDVGGVVLGDDLVAVETVTAPRGRLVRIPLGETDPGNWSVLKEESTLVLRSVYVMGEYLVLHAIDALSSRLLVLERDGTYLEDIPLPDDCQVLASGNGWVTRGERLMESRLSPADSVQFAIATYSEAPGIYSFQREIGLETVVSPERHIRGIRVETRGCHASDGTWVPYRLIYRGPPPAGRPTLVHAYGGFRLPLLPDYLGPVATILDAGGVLCVVNARGGGEYGDDWWHAGRRSRKARTFEDVFDAVSDLIDTGVADPSRIGFFGASNGGLLAGACITQRPDLFRVVIGLVPLLDMLEFSRDPLIRALARNEYGDPDASDDAEVLRAYSPVDRIPEESTLPAVLLVSGGADTRVPAWHARKFISALSAYRDGKGPIMLMEVPAAGHGLWRIPFAPSEVTAHWLGFAMRQLGLEPRSHAEV